jgi:hypothetical protein
MEKLLLRAQKRAESTSRPGKNWDLRILDPEEHLSKSPN